jgi:hypothetical protein
MLLSLSILKIFSLIVEKTDQNENNKLTELVPVNKYHFSKCSHPAFFLPQGSYESYNITLLEK